MGLVAAADHGAIEILIPFPGWGAGKGFSFAED